MDCTSTHSRNQAELPVGKSADTSEFLRILHRPGDVFEVRCLKCPHKRGGDFTSTHSGYFTDVTLAQQHIAMLEMREPPAIYCTLNPVRPELLARSTNTINARASFTTSDTDIVCRRWLFIDIDPVRPAGVSSSDDEMQAALGLACHVRDELMARGWPDALLCMSGNGSYLLYSIELPNDGDSDELVARVLAGLQQYNTAAATIDTTAVNAARILKVIGTTARKGSHLVNVPGLADRPHRQSWFEPPAGKLDPVPRALLEAIAAPRETKATAADSNGGSNSAASSSFDIARWIQKHGLDVSEAHDWPGHGKRWTLNTSPMCEHHGDGPYIGTMGSGAIVAGCHHNSCKNKWGWKELRAAIEPKVDLSGLLNDDVNARFITNGAVTFEPDDNGKLKRVVLPLEMQTVIDQVNRETGNGLAFANGSLFTVADEKVRWLEKTEDLFAHLHLVKPVRWHSGECFVTRAESRSALIGQARQYKAIESYPHEPLVQDHFYLCQSPTSGDGRTLSTFLDFFCPETQVDRDLLQAVLMTMAWGGPGGKRPAFMFLARGRGKGKTTAAEKLASVYGGCMSFSLGDNARDIKERLLSQEALITRAAILDNIKTSKFSSGDIEGIITAETISGKRMYIGEASRPNTITWMVTVNGAALSKDMSQRCIPIRLADPTFSRDWDADILEFVESNRDQLIADIIGALRGDTFPLKRYTRWGMWERDVLEKLPEPNEVQQVIRERQAALDTDAEEAGSVWDYFRSRLEDLQYDTDSDVIFIPSRVAVRWLSEGTGRTYNASSGPQYLNQQIDEGEIRNLTRSAGHAWGRGYRWTGADADPAGRETRTDIEDRIRRYQTSNPPEYANRWDT